MKMQKVVNPKALRPMSVYLFLFPKAQQRLNPDNIAKPLNSPVVRNNIYHINISAFKKKRKPDEPETPIDPLSP